MAETEALVAPAPLRRRMRWRRRLLVASLFALPFAVLAALYLYSSHTAQVRLEQALAEADRLDPGWTFAELEENRKQVADEDNAMPRIVAARQFLPFPKPALAVDRDLEDLSPAEQLSAEDQRAIAAELERLQSVLPRLREIADLPNGRYALVYSPDILDILLPHVDALNAVHIWLWFDTCQRAQAGDLEGAYRSAQALFNAGRAAGDEFLVMSQLIRMRACRQALRCIERTLAQGEISEKSLADFQRLVEAEEKFPSFLIAARGERALMDLFLQRLQSGTVNLTMLRNLGELPGPRRTGIGWVDDRAFAFSLGSLKTHRAALLDYATELTEVAKLPVEEQTKRLAGLEAKQKALPALARSLSQWAPILADAYRHSRAWLRCAAALLAVERYRIAHGRWPETLADLVPTLLAQVPLDPYDGAPLRFKRLPDGCVIYSVGPDGQDNGGNLVRVPHHKVSPGTDVGFRLWEVPRRRQPPVPRE